MKFHTQDLPFAAFLHSTRRLRFLGCEQMNGTGRITFVFEDPNGEGEHLHIAFEAGEACPAAAFYDSIRHLRRVMDGTKNSRNKGAFENENKV